MALYFFNIDERSKSLLNELKKGKGNPSSILCDSLINAFLPEFDQKLYLDALFLLDQITNNAKDWNGAKLILPPTEDKPIYYIRQALGRGIEWLKDGHHIQDADLLKDMLHFFYESPLDGGVKMEDLNSYTKSLLDQIYDELNLIDPTHHYTYSGLGSAGKDILRNWDKLWDIDLSYEVLMSIVYSEYLSYDIDFLTVLIFLKNLENQYIYELIQSADSQKQINDMEN